MPDTPLANDPTARNPDGSLKDQGAPQPETTTETPPEVKPETKPEGEGKTLLTNKDAKPEGAPEKYEAFKTPEGYKLDDTVVGEAGTLFKELGLSQASAQRLIDMYAKHAIETAKADEKAVTDMRADWRKQVESDSTLGPRLAEVKQNVSRALDSLGDAKLTAEFKAAMDLTGAGDHPAFIRAFDKLAKMVIEGKPVTAGQPSRFGQTAPGAKPQSVAQAIYPNLPSG